MRLDGAEKPSDRRTRSHAPTLRLHALQSDAAHSGKAPTKCSLRTDSNTFSFRGSGNEQNSFVEQTLEGAIWGVVSFVGHTPRRCDQHKPETRTRKSARILGLRNQR